MQTTFLNAAGTVLFVRDDMEEGDWTQEEYTVNATFPYVSDKVITRGQRIAFRDPADGAMQMFEIRNVTDVEPEHYQQIIAEHVVVSELSDEHINTTEITDKTPAQALTTVLTGTLWSLGNSSASTVSTVDIARGSVWQAVLAIQSNWNVYITPRITYNAAGNITGRYLDIAPAQGTWRGVLLTISKNVSDASIVYDDSETLTALYGYGGSVDQAVSGQDDRQVELTFADVVWSATDDHPAKPAGQTYLEDPAKTALYGRNGRPRFGYYQNGDIKDANVLLQKTWEALQQTSVPKISITGTVSDLYRFGYQDQPIRLHDNVIFQIEETGVKIVKEVIRCNVNLIDPTATRPEIGDYIPNIIYINRTTMNRVDGGASGGGGGGGGRGKTNSEYKMEKTNAWMENNSHRIEMIVGYRNGRGYIHAGNIGLAINESGDSGSYESTAYINANHVNISATDTAYTLAGDVYHDTNGRLVIKSAGGLYTEKTDQGITTQFGVWDNGNVTSGVICSTINGETSTTIKADYIDIQGIVTALEAYDISVGKITSGKITCEGIDNGENGIQTGGLTIGDSDIMLGAGGSGYFAGDVDCASLTVDGHDYAYASKTVVTGVTLSSTTNRYFIYSSGASSTTPSGVVYGKIVSSVSTDTIYYLGT